MKRAVLAVVVVWMGVAPAARGLMTEAVQRCAMAEVAPVMVFPLPRLEQSHFLAAANDAEEVAGRPALKRRGGKVHYSLSESMTAEMSYAHVFLFQRGSNQELRTHRFGAFSTARERDVLGLGMNWNWGNSRVGLGYRLESARPDPKVRAAIGGILPRSESVEHGFTLGLSRSWGGAE